MRNLVAWRRNGRLLMLGLLLSSPALLAQVEHAHPAIALTLQQDQRFHAMLPNLRCLVCQNESLAASQAPLAQDLRYQIRGMLAKGKTDAQIQDYLVARYGEYVLYKPRFEPSTWLLWAGPFLLLIGALFVALRIVRRRDATATRSATDLAEVDQAALQRLRDEDR